MRSGHGHSLSQLTFSPCHFSTRPSTPRREENQGKPSGLSGRQRPQGCSLDHPTDFCPFILQGGNVFAALIQDQSEEEEEEEEKHPPKPAKPEKNRINKVIWLC